MNRSKIIYKAKNIFLFYNEHPFHIYTETLQHSKIHDAHITGEKRILPNRKQPLLFTSMTSSDQANHYNTDGCYTKHASAILM